MSTKTQQEKVLDRLSGSGWVDGYDLCHPAIGGTEGLRRLRELRDKGYEIEKRLKPDRPKGSRVYQYRLVTRDERGNRIITQRTSHVR